MTDNAYDKLSQLKQQFPADLITTDPDILSAYAHDEAVLAPYEQPIALVRPTETKQVQQLVKLCSELQLPIIARGAGTGLSGAANAITGSVIVSFEKMNKILKIDADERIAIVQPGIVNDDFRAACAEQGLWYPPDPASAPWATIGGNVATNAGGLCCVKYGVTGDYILGMEAVVDQGKRVYLGRKTAKGVAGYDLKSLFVGSEGTLGLVTEITVRLRSIQQVEQTVVGYFADLESAGQAVANVTASGVVPSALELLDHYCLQAVDKWKNMGLAAEGKVLLLARTDASGEQGNIEADSILESFERSGATFAMRSTDPTESDALFAARKLVFPALKQLGQVLTEDICVPRTQVPQMCAAIDQIAQEHDIYVAVIAHAGDGNLHPLIVLPHDDQNIEKTKAKSAEALELIVDKAIELGGTVTGEHGVGLLKMRGFAVEVGEDVLDMHRAIKTALDPNNIFNPGKIFK